MFLRTISKNDGSDGTRARRLVRPQVWRVMAAGAAAQTENALERDKARLGIDVGVRSSSRFPWQPSVSASASALLEQFLCAYVQTGLRNAQLMRKGSGTHKRINACTMQHGFELANAHIFAPTLPSINALPTSILNTTAPPKKKKTSPEPSKETGEDKEKEKDKEK